MVHWSPSGVHVPPPNSPAASKLHEAGRVVVAPGQRHPVVGRERDGADARSMPERRPEPFAGRRGPPFRRSLTAGRKQRPAVGTIGQAPMRLRDADKLAGSPRPPARQGIVTFRARHAGVRGKGCRPDQRFDRPWLPFLELFRMPPTPPLVRSKLPAAARARTPSRWLRGRYRDGGRTICRQGASVGDTVVVGVGLAPLRGGPAQRGGRRQTARFTVPGVP